MAKDYQVEGQTYSFPDEYSDQQVQDILTKQGILKPVNVIQQMAQKGEDLASHKHRQGLQVQKGEPSVEPPPAILPALTVGAAGAMVPGAAAAIPGGTTALRALLAGGAGGGLDAAFGGDHPVRAGLETALATAALDTPMAGKILKSALPRGLQPLLSLFSKEVPVVENLRKPRITPFGGPADPGYSPPVTPRGATPRTIQGTIPIAAGKGIKSTFGGPADPGYSPPKLTPKAQAKAEGMSLETWLKKQKENAIKGLK